MSLCVAHYSGSGAPPGGCEGVGVSLEKGPPQVVLRFGVIADIQYCDIEDAQNFAKTEQRYYRGSLDGASRAMTAFQKARSERGGLSFVAQLGDLLDGQNAGGYGEGVKWADAPNSEAALDAVLGALDACEAPFYHCIGNHELYNFDLESLRRGPLNRGRHTIASPRTGCRARRRSPSWTRPT